MSEPVSILPENVSDTERALEAGIPATAPDLSPVGTLLNPEAIPAQLLGWLAWSLSVDVWDPAWPVETKRRVVAASLGVHRIKGSVASVRRALAAAGFGDVTILEGAGRNVYDGSAHHDAAILYDVPDHWAEYRVILSRPMTVAQGRTVREILARVAPARSHLKALDFTSVTNLYDAAITHTGTHTYGVV